MPRSFLARPVTTVAPELLGHLLVSDRPEGRVAVRLSEVEAYDGERDPGSHAYRGRTARNAVMFGPAGHAYVYFTYGMHWCMNVSCGTEGRASAVLLRAGEVVEGVELARARRAGRARGEARPLPDRDLARGPARLAVALGVDGTCNGVDLLADQSPLRLLAGAGAEPSLVRAGPRVGVGGAGGATPWRYWLQDDPTVSPYRAHVARRRSPA